MFLAQSAQPVWDLIVNLSSVLGYLTPAIIATWIVRGYLATNLVSNKAFDKFIEEEFNPLKGELVELKKALSERAITDAARNAKLEEQYITLMQLRRRNS